MASNLFSCEFDGMDELIGRLKKLDGDTKSITEKALKKTHGYVTPKLREDMAKHSRTGRTEQSIKERAEVNWVGSVASVDIGFDISKGGLASVFLMHGTKVYGTPRTKKDQKLYNDIYGKATTQAVRDLQQEVFYAELRKLGG